MVLKIKQIPILKGKETLQFIEKIKSKRGIIDFSEESKTMKKILQKQNNKNMIHFKGKGEHSVNELEQIILEQNEIIHNLRSKESYHTSLKFGKAEDKSKNCKLYPCSIGDWHADFDIEMCINCDKYESK